MNAALDLFGQPDVDRSPVRQLPLPLGWRPRRMNAPPLFLGRDHRVLLAALVAWRDWPTPIARLTGPPRSGKSTFAAHVAAHDPAIRVIDPAEAADELDLFHCCTAAIANRAPLLVVCGPDWTPRLADLATRMRAAAEFAMPDPAPEILVALLEARLADHHVTVPPDAAAFVAPRIERSYATLDRLVELLLDAALVDGQALTLPVVRRVGADAGFWSAASQAVPGAG